MIELCKEYSRCKVKLEKNIISTKPIGGVTRIELGNLLENFKTDILGAINS